MIKKIWAMLAIFVLTAMLLGEMFDKIKKHIIAIWKDPVWSKVIATVIIAASVAIWAAITKRSLSDIYNIVINWLNFKIPIYFILSLLGILLLYRLLKKFFRRKKDPFADETVGHFTFRELFNILVDEKIEYGTLGMDISGENLLDKIYYGNCILFLPF
ncbi:MAG: hypothetical protein WKG06_04880 [Segetibacter sp.]